MTSYLISQSMPSEVFGNHLIVMAQALHQAARILCTHEIEVLMLSNGGVVNDVEYFCLRTNIFYAD